LFIIIINNAIGLNGFYKIIFLPYHFSKKWCKFPFLEKGKPKFTDFAQLFLKVA